MRLRTHAEESRLKLLDLDDKLKQKSKDQLDLTSDMSRQYKTMQSEMIEKIYGLEGTNSQLKAKVGNGFVSDHLNWLPNFFLNN
jgi:hypothetical protein